MKMLNESDTQDAPVSRHLLALMSGLGGAALCAFNFALIRCAGEFYASLWIVGFTFLLLAPFVLVTGTPKDAATGKPPMWWTVSSISVGITGVALGIYVTELLK